MKIKTGEFTFPVDSSSLISFQPHLSPWMLAKPNSLVSLHTPGCEILGPSQPGQEIPSPNTIPKTTKQTQNKSNCTSQGMGIHRKSRQQGQASLSAMDLSGATTLTGYFGILGSKKEPQARLKS